MHHLVAETVVSSGPPIPVQQNTLILSVQNRRLHTQVHRRTCIGTYLRNGRSAAGLAERIKTC